MTFASDEKPGPLTIDIVSDVVCPWCYIGKRNLEAALATMPASNVEIRWRPYQLDATIPPEGIARRTYLERKFGTRVDEIYTRVAAAGRDAGIDFAFEHIADLGAGMAVAARGPAGTNLGDGGDGAIAGRKVDLLHRRWLAARWQRRRKRRRRRPVQV